MNTIARYGVKEASEARDDIDVAIEELELLGFTALDAGLDEARLDALSEAFDRAADTYRADAARRGFDLAAVKEADVIRVLPQAAPEFLAVACNERLHTLLGRMMGDYYILNQANGLINPANNKGFSQAAFHRDLPYQHFVVSRPIAINALFALDTFTLDNGATHVIPGSHKRERFPSEETIRRLSRQVTVPRGTFIVLDCMVYHAGGTNRSPNDRRAVNHVFTIPMFRQQIALAPIFAGTEGLTDWQKRLLGFGLEEYASVERWLESRRR